jgi:hypothetical protein
MLGLMVDLFTTYDCAGGKVPDPLTVPRTTNAVVARLNGLYVGWETRRVPWQAN